MRSPQWHAVAIRDTEMKYPGNRDDAQMRQQRYSSPSTRQDFKQPNNMKNDDDKKSAPLHLCIPSKVTCMLILLPLRFLWKPSPSLPLSKKRQSILLPIKNKAPGKDTFCNSFCTCMPRRICVSSVCAFCSSPLMEIRSGRTRLRRPSVATCLCCLLRP